MNCTDSTFFFWRLHMARPPHPGHSYIFLWSEIPIRHVRKASHWQQATIEIMRCNLLYNCLSAPCIVLLFFAHIPFVVNHTINATPPERLQQHHLLFKTNHTDRDCTFFLWRLHIARPPHPGHSTILLWSEILIRHIRKASHHGSKQPQRSPDEINLLLLVHAT